MISKAANSDSTQNKVCDAPAASSSRDDPATSASASASAPAMPPSAEEVARTVEQRGFRLAELLESEKAYVQDLEQCVAYVKYMRESKDQEEPEIPMPEDLRNGKDRMVFGNIEAIFEWHRE